MPNHGNKVLPVEKLSEGALPRPVQRDHAVPQVDHGEPLALGTLHLPAQGHFEQRPAGSQFNGL